MIQVANDSVTIANRLRPALLRLARELRREVHSLGVTGGQVSLLAQIAANPLITASELAKRERISAPGMSGHLGRLESAGLIERTRATDRRQIGLTITPEGERVLRSVRKRRTAWLVEHLNGLTDEERDRIEAAIEPLERLLEPRSRRRQSPALHAGRSRASAATATTACSSRDSSRRSAGRGCRTSPCTGSPSRWRRPGRAGSQSA
jgi:DNA-binding MarR family transcriptional regulator